jgi:hypothetical protein
MQFVLVVLLLLLLQMLLWLCWGQRGQIQGASVGGVWGDIEPYLPPAWLPCAAAASRGSRRADAACCACAGVTAAPGAVHVCELCWGVPRAVLRCCCQALLLPAAAGCAGHMLLLLLLGWCLGPHTML